jgi:hypothetical protein
MKTITEREIHLIGRRLNAKKPLKEMDKIYQLAESGKKEVRVTDEQALKGFNWLYDQYKTPRGIERKNNPFGYREQEPIDSGLDYFTYDGHFDAGNSYVSWYTPIYTFYGKDGGSFQYYVGGGKINIIG